MEVLQGRYVSKAEAPWGAGLTGGRVETGRCGTVAGQPESRVTPFNRLQWAATVPVQSAAERAVLMSLAVHADKDTLECYPRQEIIATEAGCSRATVKRALAVLRDGGLIEWRRGRYGLTYTLKIAHCELSEPGQMAHCDPSDSSQGAFQIAHSELQNRVNEPGHRTGGERSPPSTKQLGYIASLARKRGVEAPKVQTWAEASKVIDDLKDTPRESPGMMALREARKDMDPAAAATDVTRHEP